MKKIEAIGPGSFNETKVRNQTNKNTVNIGRSQKKNNNNKFLKMAIEGKGRETLYCCYLAQSRQLVIDCLSLCLFASQLHINWRTPMWCTKCIHVHISLYMNLAKKKQPKASSYHFCLLWDIIDANCKICQICDPAPINEALWGEYKYSDIHCNDQNFLHILMQNWLHSII